MSGSGSKIFIGDGETASSFEVGSSHMLTAAVDVEPMANFILSTSGSLNGISFEALENNSTVSYTASSGTQTVKPATYSNLTLSGAGLKMQVAISQLTEHCIWVTIPIMKEDNSK